MLILIHIQLKGGFFFRNVAFGTLSLVHPSAMGGYFDGIHWGI